MAVISGHSRLANASSWCAIAGANTTIATPTAATRGTSDTAGSWICVNAASKPAEHARDQRGDQQRRREQQREQAALANDATRLAVMRPSQ